MFLLGFVGLALRFHTAALSVPSAFAFNPLIESAGMLMRPRRTVSLHGLETSIPSGQPLNSSRSGEIEFPAPMVDQMSSSST